MKRFLRIQAILLSVILLSLSIAPYSQAAEFEPVQVQSFDALKKAAKAQVAAQDHTKLKSPAPYYFLFLAYTKVSYNNKTYTMTAAQKKHLYEVAENFKLSVEKAANNNVKIIIDVGFINTLFTIPKVKSGEIIDIDIERIKDDLARLNAETLYDSVLTTSVVPESIEGVASWGIDAAFGYGYFKTCEPVTIPDKTVPTAMETLYAIHEWLHQLEAYGELLDIDFPDIHAYAGVEADPAYADYQVYEKDTMNDFWYFYRDVLAGKILYKGKKYIGMYPKMWQVTPQARRALATQIVRISNMETGRYLVAEGSDLKQIKTLGAGKGYWEINRYGNYLRLSKGKLSLDIDNGVAEEGNLVKLYYCWDASDKEIDAQVWKFKAYKDGSFALCSKLDSSLVLTLNKDNPLTLEKEDGSARQRWKIGSIEETTNTVTFNTKVSNTVKLKAVTIGGTVKKPTGLSKKGYVFVGWYSDSACKKAFDFKTKITKDITVHAKWTPVKGSITPTANTVKKNKTLKLKANGNATIKSVKWTTSDSKIISLSGATKVQCTIKGVQKGKTATIKAVITFKDGTRKTISRSIKVT